MLPRLVLLWPHTDLDRYTETPHLSKRGPPPPRGGRPHSCAFETSGPDLHPFPGTRPCRRSQFPEFPELDRERVEFFALSSPWLLGRIALDLWEHRIRFAPVLRDCRDSPLA